MRKFDGKKFDGSCTIKNNANCTVDKRASQVVNCIEASATHKIAWTAQTAQTAKQHSRWQKVSHEIVLQYP